jgi:hypothetical protein
MSATDAPTDCAHASCPEDACEESGFGLDWLPDDPVTPERVTVAPADPESPATEWLSVDVAATVSLEAVR